MSTLRQALTASLEVTHSRHAIRRPQTRQTIGQPAEWIEPMRNREDAISEAKRIAEEESIFGCGFAWLSMDHWYATDFRPGIAAEIITIEVSKTGTTETDEGSRGWRLRHDEEALRNR